MAQKQILIVCGEPSGDLHAGELAKAILAKEPAIKIFGVGGSHLRQTGAEIFCDIKELSAFGVFDALKKLPQFLALKKLALEKIAEKKPDLVILIDFSGFNLRLARAINKRIPVFYYISPQVWASRGGRVKTIKKYVDKMLVLFGFEQDFYQRHGVDVDFVGHPLLDIVKPSLDKNEFLKQLNLSPDKTTLALLPGSRKAEIENILPVMLGAAILLRKNMAEIQVIIAKSPEVKWRAYQRYTEGLKLNLKIVEGKTYDCLNVADFCLVCSGTATLETAIMQKPLLVIYKMNPLNYLLYRPQVKVPYIGMVNIVAGRLIVPEFVQFQATPRAIAETVLKILANPNRLAEIKNNLAQVKAALGRPGASSRAAQIIVDFLNQ